MYTSDSSIVRALFMWACIALFSSLSVTSVYASAAEKDQTTVVILGDSLSAAYGIQVEEGWVALLQEKLEGEPVQIINASISGETTGGGLRTLPALLDKHTPDLVVIELGANDGLRGFPIQVFERNLDKLVQLSKEKNADVMLIGNHIPPNYGKDYSNAFFEIYAKVATKHQVSLVPFMLDEVAIYPELMQKDGLHPKANAQPKILRTIWTTLGPLLELTK